MNNSLQLFIKKILIITISIIVIIVFVKNYFIDSLISSEVFSRPLVKIEKEIIRAANGDGIKIEESQELLESLRIIYNRDIKIILEAINSPEPLVLSE